MYLAYSFIYGVDPNRYLKPSYFKIYKSTPRETSLPIVIEIIQKTQAVSIPVYTTRLIILRQLNLV